MLEPDEITGLLQNMRNGDPTAEGQLIKAMMNASGGVPAQGVNGEQWAFLVARVTMTT